MKELADVQAGDEVVEVYVGGWQDSMRRVTVTRTTPSTIFIDMRKFWRKDGRAVGDTSWRTPKIVPLNDKTLTQLQEIDAANELLSLRHRVRDECIKCYKRLSAEDATEILVILKRETPTRDDPQ